jgi:hypothetical protein
MRIATFRIGYGVHLNVNIVLPGRCERRGRGGGQDSVDATSREMARRYFFR